MMKTTILGMVTVISFSLNGQQTSVSGTASWQVSQGQKGKTGYFTYSIKGDVSETWLVVDNLSADLEIVGVSGTDLKMESRNYRGMPEKAKGLKPLTASGPENTGIGLSLQHDGTTILLSGAHRESDHAEYTFFVPRNLKLKINYASWQAGDITIKNMAGEVEAKSQVGDLVFVDVTGPVVAHTLSSDLEVSFSSLAGTSPTSLSSTSGDIDITLPTDTKGTFKMSTMTGGIYTAYDFDFGENANIRRPGGQSAVGALNGGGVEVSLKTISGDIYIRKSGE